MLIPGLTLGKIYTYTVTMRDVFANRSSPSSPASANTDPTGLKLSLRREADTRTIVSPKGIDINSQGRHTVMIYALNGKLIKVANGVGSAHYSIRDRYGRGVYIVHVITPKQNIRQRVCLF
jgi:hypothetical protein